MSATYGREALRRLRERQAREVEEPEQALSILSHVPPDAPMDDATLTVWNGERFVAWDRWLATAPLTAERERPEAGAAPIPADATCVAAECGGARIWLVKDGERWLMYVGTRSAGGRRRDFASPFLAHAIRTAEQWYGAPAGGWRVEKARDGKGAGRHEAADLPPQDSTEGNGDRGHGDVDLDWC